jgi:hypothetical protein
MKLDAVTQAYALLSRSWFLWMTKPDGPMLVFDASVNGTPSLSNVGIPTLVADDVYTWCFQAKVILRSWDSSMV